MTKVLILEALLTVRGKMRGKNTTDPARSGEWQVLLNDPEAYQEILDSGYLDGSGLPR